MSINQNIQALLSTESRLAENFIRIAEYHKTENGIYYGCQEMASISKEHEKEILRVVQHRYNMTNGSLIKNPSLLIQHETGFDLGTDLRFMWLLSKECGVFNELLLQSATLAADDDLELLCSKFRHETSRQSDWLFEMMMVFESKTAVV